jgi:hypothetical protein
MSRALLVAAALPEVARRQARRGREYVCREWSREKAFAELQRSLIDVAKAAADAIPASKVAA